MSKWILAVCGLVLCLAAVSYAADEYPVYNQGSGALYVEADPYGGNSPPGMRFGDARQVGGVIEVGYGGCQNCYGVAPPPCDPCWRGPCIDWKQVGWYSHWSDHHGCGRKNCCAAVSNTSCPDCNCK